MRVEGVDYEVDWSDFRVGSSFLIPCLDPKNAEDKISAVTKRLHITVVTKVVIEDGIRGLRVWAV